MGSTPKASRRNMPALVGNPVVLDLDPSSLINLMLNGSIPLVARGTPDAYRMPQFRQQLSDRTSVTSSPSSAMAGANRATAVTAAQVTKLRKTTDPASDRVVILKCVRAIGGNHLEPITAEPNYTVIQVLGAWPYQKSASRNIR